MFNDQVQFAKQEDTIKYTLTYDTVTHSVESNFISLLASLIDTRNIK